MKRIFLETEATSPVHYGYPVSKVLYRGRSKYQKLLVFDSPRHGRVMALDNIVQITTREEPLYHEALIHPVLQAHPNPKTALVIGGGDGGAVTQLVKYPSLEKIIETELDEQVVRAARKYFRKVASGYQDPRVTLLFTDGYEYLDHTSERFDIIIVDLTDPIGPAKALFEEPFYRLCAERLTENGFLSAQTESIHNELTVVKNVYGALFRSFPHVEWVNAALAMYPGNWWIFSTAGKSLNPRVVRNPFVPTTEYYIRDIHEWYFVPAPLRLRLLSKKQL